MLAVRVAMSCASSRLEGERREGESEQLFDVEPEYPGRESRRVKPHSFATPFLAGDTVRSNEIGRLDRPKLQGSPSRSRAKIENSEGKLHHERDLLVMKFILRASANAYTF